MISDTDAVTAPFIKFISKDDAAAGVPAPITTTAAVALATVQDPAAVPEPGVAPTRALHAKPGMKLAPVTVMVLPARTRARRTWPSERQQSQAGLQRQTRQQHRS